MCVSAPEPEAEDIHMIALVVSQKNLGGVVSQKIISCTTPVKPLGGVEKQRNKRGSHNENLNRGTAPICRATNGRSDCSPRESGRRD